MRCLMRGVMRGVTRGVTRGPFGPASLARIALAAGVAGLALLALGVARPCGAQTPRVLWERRVVRAPAVGLSVSGDTLWVVGTDRKLHSLDANDGDRHWRKTLVAPAVLSPVPAGSLLLVAVSSRVSGVVALERDTGKVRWAKRTTSQPVALLRADSTVLSLGTDGQAVAFRLGDGEQRWERDLEAKLAGGVACSRGAIALGRTDSLWCLDPADGHDVWSLPIDGFSVGDPALAADSSLIRALYAGGIVEHRLDDGREVRRRATRGPQERGPAILDGTLGLVATGGEVEILDARTWERLWGLETKETAFAGLVGWEDLWTFPSVSGRLLAWTRDRGSLVWTLQFRSALLFPPAQAGRYYAVVDDRGRVVVYTMEPSG